MTELELHSRLYPEAHKKNEYIICAAIHYDDGINHDHQPKNIKTGFVMCGRRHHNIIATLCLISNIKTTRQEVQGFLTSKDRFLNREEAAQLAFEAKQVSDQSSCLFSEDLY